MRQTLGLLWESSHVIAGGTAAMVIVNGCLAAATLVNSGFVVGSIPGALHHGLGSRDGHRLFMHLWLMAALAAASTTISIVQEIFQQQLTWRFIRTVSRRAMNACLGRPGIAHLEDSSFVDQLALATSTPGSTPYQVPQSLLVIVQTRLGGIASAVILLRFAWWAPPLLMVAMYLENTYMNKELDLLFQFYGAATPETRRSAYYRSLAVMPEAAKEIRIYGLPGWVIGRYTAGWRSTMENIWRQRRGLRWNMVRQGLVDASASTFVFVMLARAGLHGAISLSSLAVYIQAVAGMRGFGSVGDAQVQFRNGANSIPHLLGLEKHPASARAALPGDERPTGRMPAREVRFVDVTFRYPGTERPVFDGLNLVMQAGQSLAIVGDNGAGKTTLVKLLARLYDPDSGRIEVDGVDLRDLAPEAWRRQVAVIFQDFIKYPFSARDNIGVGALDRAGDEGALNRAAAVAGADTVIAGLPKGWDTLLSREYTGGRDLSGGQWQKVALGRALLGAQRGGVLVLDEPTANLDVRSEVELFDRFIDLTAGTTAVLISHRFSTVRRVDRICVLEHGRVVEDGTHDELVAGGGRYARMYGLQAERFLEDAPLVGGTDE